MKVSKFGGSSLANSEQIRKVCNIIIKDPERKVIVVSAPGKRHKDDDKVTDLLINCAQKYIDCGLVDSEFEKIIARYREICSDLGLSDQICEEVIKDIKARVLMKAGNKEKYMDIMKAAGEDNCAKIVAEFLKSQGIAARYVNPKDAGLLLTDDGFAARVLPESYDNLKNYFSNINDIVIFPGFFGYSSQGEVVTFPRGGSDITGSILAAALKADIYENFTDVDNVFSANPNIINQPKPITKLTYREMRELSYAGFSVLHEETLEPVYRMGIPVCIKNTNNPDCEGTMIVTECETRDNLVVGIASDTGFCSIYVSKYLMNREVGFGRKILSILESESIPYEHIPSGIDNISIVLHEKKLGKISYTKLMERIKNELKVDDIHLEKNLAMIMIVGEGMRHSVGVASKAVDAFAGENINIEMMNQGSSEVSIMFAVKEEDHIKAVKALYKVFFE